MTKEQLLELGLTEEQIQGVFKLNGIAVENAKGDVRKLEQELETVKTEKQLVDEKLKTANEKIEEFKDFDVEGLTSKIKAYEDNLNKLNSEHENEIKNLTKKQKVTVEALQYNPHDVKDVLQLVDLDRVDLTDNGVFGLKEQIETLKESKPYLFKEKDKVDDVLKGTDPVDPINKGYNPKPETYDDFLKMIE